MADPTEVLQSCINKRHVLVDIRDKSAWSEGIPKGAITMSAEQLLNRSEELANQFKTIHVICYKGLMSQQLCEQLAERHSEQFSSVIGGFEAWHKKGLAVEKTDVDIQAVRYIRQESLPEFGQSGQHKLKQSHVLMVGAGGLGSPALLYLAGSGVGAITVVDDDIIALHNLHRQVLYSESDVGQSKSEVAKKHLSQLNSNIKITAVNQRLSSDNVDELLRDVDVVIDGSDNIDTRYTINDACKRHQLAWVFAAVSGFHIQLALFSGRNNDVCYRCLFPELNDEPIGNCNEEGILGFVPGIAGLMQCTEAIKYLTNLGTTLNQQMLTYDVLNHQYKVLKYPASKTCNH